ncbi:MAG: SDR family oxidoreductase [Deltaproteobacteria bacterium]|nr:SDR family oxidoreductase [Deltaproteobacteria bacterium]
MAKRSLLVTGASGQLGGEVVRRLVARGGDDVIIAGSREVGKLAGLDGVTPRRVDFDDDEATLQAAFEGVDRALIISTDALDRPGRRAEQHLRAIRAAKAAGVKHLLYTSLAKAADDSAIPIAQDHVLTERALAASGLGHTVLRNNLYAEVLVGAVGHAVSSGQLITARGEGAIAYVTRSDCARAAAAALASSFDGQRVLEITGPEAVTGDQIAAMLTELSGRPVAHLPVPVEAYVQGLVQAGLPEPYAQVYASFEVAAARGELGEASGAVEALSGEAATPLRVALAGALKG